MKIGNSYLCFFAQCFFGLNLHGQVFIKEYNPTYYDFYDEAPQFPGGPDSLKNFIKRNLEWPGPMWCGQGTVYFRLFIDRQGKIQNHEIIRGIDSSANSKALQLVKKLPNWVPAKINNQVVNSKAILRVRFYLD